MMLVKRVMVNRLKNLCDYKPQTEPEENDVINFEAIDHDLKARANHFINQPSSPTLSSSSSFSSIVSLNSILPHYHTFFCCC